jgi:hypothetical protein
MITGEMALRPAGEIFREVETFAEARSLLDAFAERDFGGMVIRGVADSLPDRVWQSGTELADFAYEATNATKHPSVGKIELQLRLMPVVTGSDLPREPITFTEDSDMHFDGYNYGSISDEDEESFATLRPLHKPEAYLGVSHHLTLAGRGLFVIDRLSETEEEDLVRGQLMNDGMYRKTNPIRRPMSGEAIGLTAGDYIVMHSYAVMGKPVFVHGSAYATKDRRSYCYNPRRVTT